MSLNTPNRLRIPSNVLNTTSATAPSLTDPSLNNAFKNQVVTVGTDTYFVDATGKAQKLGSAAATNIKAKLAPVLDLVTAAQLAALTTQNPGDSYIVLDGANKGDIATWDGTTWLYYTPTNGDQTTVTTGSNLGTWQYDLASDTWIQITTGIDLPDPIVRPVAGNIALTSQNEYSINRDGGFIVLVNDQLVSYGTDPTFNAGDSTATDSMPHKIPFSWNDLLTGPTNRVASAQVPVFVDGANNSDYLFGLDSRGKLWSMGVRVANSGLTTTATSNTAVPNNPTFALYPVKFFHDQNIALSKVYVSSTLYNTGTTSYAAALSTNGTLYLTGNNSWGQQGQGNTTAAIGWVTYPIANVVEVKLAYQSMLVRTASGELYFTGFDAGGMFGAANGNRTTPTLVTTGVASFDHGHYQTSNIHIVKTDGTYWNMGKDANGELGRGTVLATGVRPLAQVLTGVKRAYGGKFDGTKTILLMTDGTIRVAGVNTNGMLGYTPNASAVNNPTFVIPTGGFQGTVVDVIVGYNVSTLLTADGAIWNAGTLQDRGFGRNTNVWVDNNKWMQVPLPGKVIGFRCMHEVTTNNDGTLVLMENHKLYGWGSSFTSKWSAGGSFGYAPKHIPTNQLDNGIAIENPLSQTI